MESSTKYNIVLFIIITVVGFILVSTFDFFGMVAAYILNTKYMEDFALRPLAKMISSNDNTPKNYIFGKLKTFRGNSWIIATLLNLPIIFVVEMIVIAISVREINEMKRNMGIPIEIFSKKDYLVYEEYWKYCKNEEVMQRYFIDEKVAKENVIKDHSQNKNSLVNNIENDKREEINVEQKEEGRAEEILFEEKEFSTEEEISCEKCGNKMSRMKIVCPKCGALVKNTYKNDKNY